MSNVACLNQQYLCEIENLQNRARCLEQQVCNLKTRKASADYTAEEEQRTAENQINFNLKRLDDLRNSVMYNSSGFSGNNSSGGGSGGNLTGITSEIDNLTQRLKAESRLLQTRKQSRAASCPPPATTATQNCSCPNCQTTCPPPCPPFSCPPTPCPPFQSTCAAPIPPCPQNLSPCTPGKRKSRTSAWPCDAGSTETYFPRGITMHPRSAQQQPNELCPPPPCKAYRPPSTPCIPKRPCCPPPCPPPCLPPCCPTQCRTPCPPPIIIRGPCKPCDPCNPCSPSLTCRLCTCKPSCPSPCCPACPPNSTACCRMCKPCKPCKPCRPASTPCGPCQQPVCMPCLPPSPLQGPPCLDMAPTRNFMSAIPNNLGRRAATVNMLCQELVKCNRSFDCCISGVAYSSASFVRVVEVHPTGKYIKLMNTSAQKAEEIGCHFLVQQQLGGWPLSVFKFPERVHFPAQSTIKIWTSCSDPGLYKPPTDFVFRQLLRWSIGANISTLLCQPDGRIVSWMAGCNVICTNPCCKDRCCKNPCCKNPCCRNGSCRNIFCKQPCCKDPCCADPCNPPPCCPKTTPLTCCKQPSACVFPAPWIVIEPKPDRKYHHCW